MNRLGPMPRFHRQIRAIHQPTSPTSRRRCQRLRPPMRQRCDGGRPCHRGPVSWQLAEQCGIPARANSKRGSHLTSEDGSAKSGSANNEKHKATIYQRLEMLVVLHCIHQEDHIQKIKYPTKAVTCLYREASRHVRSGGCYFGQRTGRLQMSRCRRRHAWVAQECPLAAAL